MIFSRGQLFNALTDSTYHKDCWYELWSKFGQHIGWNPSQDGSTIDKRGGGVHQGYCTDQYGPGQSDISTCQDSLMFIAEFVLSHESRIPIVKNSSNSAGKNRRSFFWQGVSFLDVKLLKWLIVGYHWICIICIMWPTKCSLQGIENSPLLWMTREDRYCAT